MSRRYLALDLGAESGRSMLAELVDRKLSLTELHRFANIPVRLPNGLYWDTFRLFYDICEGIRASAKVADRLDGIAVDTWGVDFGLIAADGSLIDCPRHYRDARMLGTLEQVFAKVPRADIFRQTGIQFMEINSLYQLFALQRDSPGALANTRKLLFMPDLFNYFLTGAYACERTIASTSQFYDPVKRGFATDMLRKLGISGSFFAELVDPGAQLGPLLPQVVEHCGLKHDPMVYATGSHDTASAVAATPAVDDSHWCYISSGTWSLMGVETDKPVINNASLEANFTNEAGVGGKIRLLKNIAGLWILQECRRAWARTGDEYTYAELMERAAAAKPTETVIDPDDFVLPGNHPERICEFCRKSGQKIPTDAGSITLVILQSLAVRYKEVLDTLERLTGRSISTIHIVGGGSRNRLLNQLAADRTGRKVIAGPVEATAAGNALTQAMGSGDVLSLPDLRSIVRRSFEVEEFLPN
jgi:rhamnulokinase